MLTDEELITRLSAAFHEVAPELRYAGPVPEVRRRHTGLVATSAMAAAAALALTPAALQRGDDRAPTSGASSRASEDTLGHRVVHTLDIAGLHLSDASVEGNPGPVYYTGGDGLTIPPDAEKVDVGLPVDVYFVDHPASGEPQVYVESQSCPDTNDPCPTPPPTHVYGILAVGWSRQQLMEFLEHPVRTERSHHH